MGSIWLNISIIYSYTDKQTFELNHKQVDLNDATRKSRAGRKRLYEISRGSTIEIGAALKIANDLNYLAGIDTAWQELHCFAVSKSYLRRLIPVAAFTIDDSR